MENAALPHFKRFDAVALAALIVTHVAGFYALRHLGIRSVLWVWIAYECVLLFSHLPFPFTNTLYRAASWLYDHMNPTLYWGMEAGSALFACVAVGAPLFVLFNALTHGAFLVFAYRHSARPTSLFYSAPRKMLRFNALIIIDNLCHITCLWFYLRAALGSAATATSVWAVLLAVVASFTFRFHRDEVRLSHFLHYLRFDPAPRPIDRS